MSQFSFRIPHFLGVTVLNCSLNNFKSGIFISASIFQVFFELFFDKCNKKIGNKSTKLGLEGKESKCLVDKNKELPLLGR